MILYTSLRDTLRDSLMFDFDTLESLNTKVVISSYRRNYTHIQASGQ